MDEDGNGSVDDDRVEDDEGNTAATVAVVELSLDPELRRQER